MPNPEENKKIEGGPEKGETGTVEGVARDLTPGDKARVVEEVKKNGRESIRTTTTTTTVEEMNFGPDIQFQPLNLATLDITKFSPKAQASIEAINAEHEAGTAGKVNRLAYTRAHYQLPYNQVSLGAMKSNAEWQALGQEMQRVMTLTGEAIVDPSKIQNPEEREAQQKKFVAGFHIEGVASPKNTSYVSSNPANPFLGDYNLMMAQGESDPNKIGLQCNQMLAWDRAEVARQRLVEVVGVPAEKVSISSTAVRELPPGVNDADIPGVNIEGVYGSFDQTITNISNVSVEEVRFNDQMDVPIGFTNLKPEMREQLKDIVALPNLGSLAAIQGESQVEGYLTDGYWIWSGIFQNGKLIKGKITQSTGSGNVIISTVRDPGIDIAGFLKTKRAEGKSGSQVDKLLSASS